jgi:hypothetical protein
MSSMTVQMSAPAVRFHGVPADGARRSRLRLTRRGRLVLGSVVSLPLIAAALWFGLDSGVVAAAQSSTQSSAGAFEHVTVKPGESLWQVAQTVAPHADPRDVVDALVDMNGLQTTVVTPGQTLVVPPQYAR